MRVAFSWEIQVEKVESLNLGEILSDQLFRRILRFLETAGVGQKSKFSVDQHIMHLQRALLRARYPPKTFSLPVSSHQT